MSDTPDLDAILRRARAHGVTHRDCYYTTGPTEREADTEALVAYVLRLERERDAARTAALHEAAAVLRGLAREYLDRTIRSGNYMSALNDAASRIEALATAARESEPTPPAITIYDVEGDL